MINAIQTIYKAGMSAGLPAPAATSAPQGDIAFFQQQLGADPASNVNSAIKNFVEKAQEQVEQSKVEIDKQLRSFNSQNNVASLVNAMYTSSMKSVSIQLTGKIGSKVSESFEQLVKQQ